MSTAWVCSKCGGPGTPQDDRPVAGRTPGSVVASTGAFTTIDAKARYTTGTCARTPTPCSRIKDMPLVAQEVYDASPSIQDTTRRNRKRSLLKRLHAGTITKSHPDYEEAMKYHREDNPT